MNFPELTREFVEKTAKLKGWSLCPDKEHLEAVVNGLSMNRSRYGRYVCPCRDTSGDIEKDRDIICPCPYALLDIKDWGHCFCGLFTSTEFSKSGKEISSIPERRPAANN